jgi:hypothetical protein
MDTSRITINGQQYDSPEHMPPDVRQTYEEAMRAAAPLLAKAQSTGSTQVFTGGLGQMLGASVVVNKTITVNGKTYGSADELPPEMRQLHADALAAAAQHATQPKTRLHVSVNFDEKLTKSHEDASRPRASGMRPIDASSISSIRGIPISLGIAIIIGLLLWALLGDR